MTVEEIKDIVSTKLVEFNHMSEELLSLEAECSDSEILIADMVEAKNVISEASRVTQMQFKEFVESLVTLAIQSVFPEKDYQFVVDFVLQSNRSMINLLVKQGDKEPYVPEEEQGGALLDVIGFALRVVMWSLEKPRSRNVFISDEPFRWTGAYTERVANMMKEICNRLDIQVIVVTHDERLSEIADRSWRVFRNAQGYSEVKCISEEVEVKPVIKIKRRKS